MFTISIKEECRCLCQDVLKNFDSLGFEAKDFYLLHNGKIIFGTDTITSGLVHVVPRLRGGKGGFGSMLRAIGAQIEKTTNREACRDLSGRRLRDINEEKRLKNWITQQAERERETAERRKKKLERLCVEPKHEFRDKSYEQERSQLAEKVNDAVEQGFKATSSGTNKRKLESQSTATKKKKCLWLDGDADLSFGESDDSLGSEDEKSPSCVKSQSNKSVDDQYANPSLDQAECKPSTSNIIAASSVTDIEVKPSDCGGDSSSGNCVSESSSHDEDRPQGSDVCSMEHQAVKTT